MANGQGSVKFAPADKGKMEVSGEQSLDPIRCSPFAIRLLASDLLAAAATAHALFQKLDVVLDVRVGRVLRQGLGEPGAGAVIIAAQHVGEALVVENLRRTADDGDGGRIGAVGEVEALEPVVGRRQANPGLGLALGRNVLVLDHAPEKLFGEAVVFFVELALAHPRTSPAPPTCLSRGSPGPATSG